MNLYEIKREILDCIDFETGEIIDYEKLEALSIEKDEKIENVLLWIKNLKAEAAALQAEKLAFAKRQKVCENQIERLEKYITDILCGDEWESAKVKASFRKSDELIMAEGAKIPVAFRKQNIELDKAGIKAAIKSGKKFIGFTIIEKQNLQIK